MTNYITAEDTVPEHIEEIYQALIADCNREDSRKNLKVLKETLDEQVRRGSTVFQLPTLAKIMKEKGGAGLSALKNQSGERYRTLINSYKEEYEKSSPAKQASSSDDWIDRIDQSDIKFLVKDMRAQLRKLRAENDSLRNIKELSIDMRPQGTQLEFSDDNLASRKSINLNTSQRETAAKLLDEKELEKRHLYYDEKGALWYKSGKYPVQITDRRLRSIFELILTVSTDDE